MDSRQAAKKAKLPAANAAAGAGPDFCHTEHFCNQRPFFLTSVPIGVYDGAAGAFEPAAPTYPLSQEIKEKGSAVRPPGLLSFPVAFTSFSVKFHVLHVLFALESRPPSGRFSKWNHSTEVC
jgi:hypothetical protein